MYRVFQDFCLTSESYMSLWRQIVNNAYMPRVWSQFLNSANCVTFEITYIMNANIGWLQSEFNIVTHKATRCTPLEVTFPFRTCSPLSIYLLNSGEICPTRCNNCVFLFTVALHVSGDNLTHHQEYNAVYGHRWAGSLRLLLNLSVVK